MLSLKALLVEDCEDDALLILRALRQGGFEVASQRVQEVAALAAALAQPRDILLSDFSILGFSGMDALLLCRSLQSDVPFILVSGTVGEEMAVAVMKAGANDYVMKHSLTRLAPAVRRELDNFKTIDDTHGHDAGDQILKLVAARLCAGMRIQDTVARTGGDEFVIILEKLSGDADTAAREVDAIGHDILGLTSAPYEHDGVAYRISASIGVVLFWGTEHSSDELMKRADIALYSARAGGRKRPWYSKPTRM